MPNEHEGQHAKFLGLMTGVVVDVADPKKSGRVRINIPGIAEPTGWARKLGGEGGGGKKRGSFGVPPVDSEVGCFFKMGDPDHPFYLAGWPGQGEAPEETEGDTSAEDAPKVFAHETERWRFVADDRPGKNKLSLTDKITGDVIEIDGAALAIRVQATSAIKMTCDGAIDIHGSSMTIMGRVVVPNGKPI